MVLYLILNLVVAEVKPAADAVRVGCAHRITIPEANSARAIVNGHGSDNGGSSVRVARAYG